MTGLFIVLTVLAGGVLYALAFVAFTYIERVMAVIVGACGDIAWKAGRVWHRMRVRDGRRG